MYKWSSASAVRAALRECCLARLRERFRLDIQRRQQSAGTLTFS